jgi:hypothetical protein
MIHAMHKFGLIVLAATLSGSRQPHRKLALGAVAGYQADAASTFILMQKQTCYELHNEAAGIVMIAPNPTGWHEANPVLKPVAKNSWIFPAMLGAAAAVNWTARKLDRRGHHHWATGLRWGAVVDGSVSAAWNFTRPCYEPTTSGRNLRPLPPRGRPRHP